MIPRPQILLVAPNASYRISDFLAAAERLKIDAIVASDRCRKLSEKWPSEKQISIDFSSIEESAKNILEHCRSKSISAAIGVDDVSVELAAILNQRLGLPGNSLRAAQISRNKYFFRKKLAENRRLRSPEFCLVKATDEIEGIADEISFPCVLKPLFLSGSRGVIRANNLREFKFALNRIRKILNEAEFAKHDVELRESILVEDYIPGKEIAIEGLLTQDKLDILAVFDKPDPLTGPYFEETLYITPSRLSHQTQNHIFKQLALACETLGLRHGPIHAEARLNKKGVFFLEIAARTIGGLCSRTLSFASGTSLEELVLKHAVGETTTPKPHPNIQASGVMMIPIPKGGKLESFSGVDEASRVNGVQGVHISASPGSLLVPLPEGSSYLGFIFAKGGSPEFVENSLRKAHACLGFDIRTTFRPMMAA